jgi:hypothetical protein
MIRRIVRSALACTAAALVALAFAAGPLHADLGGPGPDSLSRLLMGLGCALAIAAASSGFGLAAVLVTCVRVLIIDA